MPLLFHITQLQPVTDLHVIHDSEHERTVQFTVPENSSLQNTISYDIRISPQAVNEQDNWESLARPTIYAQSDSPAAGGKQQEIYLDDVPEHSIIAIRIKDTAENFSEITNEEINE